MNVIASTWFATNRNKFSPQNQAIIQSKLNEMTDDKATILSSIELKDPTTMLIIEIFFGELGVHRFMLGQTGMGVFMLLTGGLCGILWLIDMFTVSRKTQEYNFLKVMPYL